MPSRRPDLPALTGLRFAAAVAVVLVHLRGHLSALLPATAVADPALRAGFLGVELFFVLSGFILGYHYLETFSGLRPGAWARFLRHRLARIYPLHVATLGLLALFVGVRHAGGQPVSNPEAYGVGDLVANLTLTQCWTVRACEATWNGPAWSLSAEWLAYLAFPVLALLLGRVRRGGVLLLGVLAVTAAQLWLSEVAHLDGGIPRIATTFTLGVLLARLHVSGVPSLRWDAVAVWAAATAGVVAVALSTAGHAPTAVVPLFGLLVLALANAPRGRLSRALAGPRMRFWGEASYGLYMTHALVLAVGAEFIRLELVAAAGLPVRLGLLAGYGFAMLLVAAVAYQQIERPWRLLLRGGRGVAMRPVAAPPAPDPVPAPVPAAVVVQPQHMAQSAPIS